MNKSMNVLLGVIGGLIVGTAIGMLAAPHKGSVNRRMLRKRGKDIVDEVSDKITASFEEISDTISNKIEDLKKEAVSRLS